MAKEAKRISVNKYLGKHISTYSIRIGKSDRYFTNLERKRRFHSAESAFEFAKKTLEVKVRR